MAFNKRGLAPLSLFLVLPHVALACACGCGVFDVSTASMLPTGKGGTVWLEQDYMNQKHNWHGSSSASDLDNDDKKIRSSFTNLGAQYMFNRDWGVKATIPYVDRNFVTTDDTTGDIVSYEHGKIGDIRISGIYSGFSPDMSTGVTFGVKLPNGDFTNEGFDRDTALGTGSTDALIGAYHMGHFPDKTYGWFVSAVWDQPILTKDSYRPGTEIDGATGVYFEGWQWGKFSVTPIAQVIGGQRWHDSGAASEPDNTGYTRFLASPGVQFAYGKTKLYADVEVPFYQNVKGDQLVAPELFKVMMSYDF